MKTIHNDADQQSTKAQESHPPVVDSIPSLVWSARPDGYIDFLNQRWIEYTGLSFEQIEDWGWIDTDFIHPEDLQNLIDAWRAILASGEPDEAEARMRRFAITLQ